MLVLLLVLEVPVRLISAPPRRRPLLEAFQCRGGERRLFGLVRAKLLGIDAFPGHPHATRRRSGARSSTRSLTRSSVPSETPSEPCKPGRELGQLGQRFRQLAVVDAALERVDPRARAPRIACSRARTSSR